MSLWQHQPYLETGSAPYHHHHHTSLPHMHHYQEKMNCGMSLQKPSRLNTYLDAGYGGSTHQVLDNGLANYYHLYEDSSSQLTYPELSYLQQSLSALRLSTTSAQNSPHHHYASPLSPSAALLSPNLHLPVGGSNSLQSLPPRQQPESNLLPPRPKDQQYHSEPLAGMNRSMFGLSDINVLLESSSSSSLLSGGGVREEMTAVAAPSSSGWNPLMSTTALPPMVAVNRQQQPSMSSSSAVVSSVPADNDDEDSNPIEEYIFYSDDEEIEEGGSSTSSLSGDDQWAVPFSALQRLTPKTGQTGRTTAAKKRSSNSLLHHRTAAALDADLRPPSPPPSVVAAANKLSAAHLSPPLCSLPKASTSWSQVVQTVGPTIKSPSTAPLQASSFGLSSSATTVSSVLSSSTSSFAAVRGGSSPSPPPGKSISPAPEFHRGPRVDPRWPVSQQVFLGPIPMSITWDEIRNTFYSRVSRSQILHTYVQSKPVNDVVYGQVVFDKTSLANKMLKEGPIKVRGHLIHMTSMKDKINWEKRK